MKSLFDRLFKKKRIIQVTYTNRQLDKIKARIAEGFTAVWTAGVWVLTKIFYA